MLGVDFLKERDAIIDELFYLADNFISVEDFWLGNFIFLILVVKLCIGI